MSYKKPVSDDEGAPKLRDCLACRRPFNSTWVGERICHKCKSSSSWRNGSSRPFVAAKRS
ncbi:MAG: hypothetical protein GEU76_01265 [Alphaproteobacteria bacterium]|jgi:hypothetical protein|nr:hypothetical protein [Alphaproteobacteria bacterium]